MRKAGIIALTVIGSALFMSCSSPKAAGNGYNGISNAKYAKQQQKEFQKPKHNVKTCKRSKVRN